MISSRWSSSLESRVRALTDHEENANIDESMLDEVGYELAEGGAFCSSEDEVSQVEAEALEETLPTESTGLRQRKGDRQQSAQLEQYKLQGPTVQRSKSTLTRRLPKVTEVDEEREWGEVEVVPSSSARDEVLGGQEEDDDDEEYSWGASMPAGDSSCVVYFHSSGGS